jgi:hypothetical protein
MPTIVPHPSQFKQRGVVLILLILTLVIGATAVGFGISKSNRSDIEKEKTTAAALAQAKAALIGFATSVDLNSTPSLVRPGDLPCPDTDDDGIANAPCGNLADTTGQEKRIGRLPWKTLGLPDLRDGDGERLWYAVSTKLKNSTRLACTAAGQPDCVNSDSLGTITIRDPSGNISLDGTSTLPGASGAFAAIFSPGPALRRLDGIQQIRTCLGGSGCNAGICIDTTTPKCDPKQYLDTSGAEDNANFIDGAANGFINGIVRDDGGNIVVNDRLIAITNRDLMPLLEQRVAKEIVNCLRLYATENGGRYPWASPIADYPNTDDKENTTFGRLARSLAKTKSNSESGGVPTMSDVWPATCVHLRGSWWDHWREQVFYAVGDTYKPAVGPPVGCGGAGTCLIVNPPSPMADKQIVVIVSGYRLTAQSRTSGLDKQNAANYVEGNYTPPYFVRHSRSAVFNDNVMFYPP